MNDKQPAMAKKGWLEKMRDLYGLMGNYTHCIWWFKCGWWGFTPLNLLVSLTRTAKPNWSNNWPTNQWLVLFNLKLCKEMQLSWQRNQGTTSCGIMGIFQQSSEVTQSYIFLVTPGNWYLNQNTPMILMYFLAIQEPMLFFCIHQQSHALHLKSMASRFVYVLIDSFPGIGCFFNAPYM